MKQWDANRRAIAEGCKDSGPRDWLEGVLDDADERIAELEADLMQRCTDLASVKHEISVALEEIAAGEQEEALGRLRACLE